MEIKFLRISYIRCYKSVLEPDFEETIKFILWRWNYPGFPSRNCKMEQKWTDWIFREQEVFSKRNPEIWQDLNDLELNWKDQMIMNCDFFTPRWDKPEGIEPLSTKSEIYEKNWIDIELLFPVQKHEIVVYWRIWNELTTSFK